MYDFARRQHYVRLDADDADAGVVVVVGPSRSPSPTGFSLHSSKRLSGVAFLRSFLPEWTEEPAEVQPAEPIVDEKGVAIQPDADLTMKTLRQLGYGPIFVSGITPAEASSPKTPRRIVARWPW